MKIACITPDRKRDYLVETVLEGLAELGVDLVVSDPGNGVTTEKMKDDEFVQQANTCDALLVFFGKVRGNQPVRRHILDSIRLPREKLVYVDGSEWRADGWDTPRQVVDSLDDPRLRRGEPWIDEEMWERCGHYFKRECWPQDLSWGVKPFPFALCDRHRVEPLTKNIDVLCSFGHVKTGLRKEAIETCERLRRETNLNILVKAGMSRDEYMNALARSRIVVDAWGGGDTTDRFWEGVGATACVLYQRYNIVVPNVFVDWRHAVSYGTAAEMLSSVNRLLNDPSVKPECIANRGLEHALQFHTARHRAEEILRAVAG